MLFLASEMQKPVRIQTAFISETEVKKVVSYIRSHNAGDLAALTSAAMGANVEHSDIAGLANNNFDDDEIDDTLVLTMRAPQLKKSAAHQHHYLQRKLKIGYSRAARLMDVLEERGVIGPADGSKPREILTRQSAPVENTVEEDTF